MLSDPSGTLVAVDEYCNIERTNQKAALVQMHIVTVCLVSSVASQVDLYPSWGQFHQ